MSKWKKISFFRGKSDFDKVSLELDPNFLLFFFQGAKEDGRQVGKATDVVLVGRKPRSEEDFLGELGNNMYAKGGRGPGYQGFEKVQLCFTWEMVLELVSSSR